MTAIPEANMLDLSDDSLKEFIGHCYESIRKLERAKKCDQTIEEMKAKLAEYKAEHYDKDIKLYRAKLKAAVAQAEVRGVKFKLGV